MQNLNRAERRDFERECARHRAFARSAPCFHASQVIDERYRFSLGPINVVFTQDRFTNPPIWHGTVSIMKEIGSEAIMDERGNYIFDAPQDAMIAVRSWDNDEYQTAREVLGKVFGELIPREDTRVTELTGVFALHWIVEVSDS